MGYFDWIWRRENVAPKPKPDPLNPDVKQNNPLGFPTEVEPSQQAGGASGLSAVTVQERARPNRYTTFNTMDAGDVATMLDSVVDAALTFEEAAETGIKVESDKTNIDVVVQAVFVKINTIIEEVTRDLLKYGDAFVEPIFVGSELVDLQPYNPNEITVNRDEKGKLRKDKDEDGFPLAFQQKRNNTVVAGWNPWEMIHFRLYPTKRLTYSRKSLLDDLIIDWKKLQIVELGMVIARVTRAYPRRVHYLDMTAKNPKEQESSMASYIRRMTNTTFGVKPRDTDTTLPVTDVSQDMYVGTGYVQAPDGSLMPRLNKIDTEDPAIAGLAELGDVEYLRTKLFGKIPADVVGIKRNTSGDVDAQDLSYARLLRRVQKQLSVGLRGIVNQALMARGIIPLEEDYTIIFPTINTGAQWKYADARFRDSLTLRNHLELNTISRRFAVKRAFNLSDRQVNSMWEEIDEEVASGRFVFTGAAGDGTNRGAVAGEEPPDDNDADTAPNGVPTNTQSSSRVAGHNSA